MKDFASSLAMSPYIRELASSEVSDDSFSIASLNNLWWFDAGQGVYQTGTTPAVADGDPVGRIVTRGDLAVDGLQATGSKQPLLKLNQINGLPALLFDGVDDEIPVVFQLAASHTIFMVFRVVTFTKTTLSAGTYFDQRKTLHIKREGLTDNDYKLFIDDLVGVIPSSAGFILSTYRLDDAFEQVIRHNGTEVARRTAGGGFTGGPLLTLGSRIGIDEFSNCSIAELVIVNSPLTDAICTNVENVLITKFAF